MSTNYGLGSNVNSLPFSDISTRNLRLNLPFRFSEVDNVKKLAYRMEHNQNSLVAQYNNLLGSLGESFDMINRKLFDSTRPAIRVYRDIGSGFNIPHATWTPIEWSHVQRQTDEKMFDTSVAPTKIYATRTGWYFIGANANLQSATGTVRRLAIRRNGSATDEDWLVRSGAALNSGTFGGASTGWSVMSVAYLETGDYVEALFYQSDSASATRALNIADGHPRMVMYLIDEVTIS